MSARARTCLRAARAGFTLIEVMIAVAILSLTISIVFANSIFALQESLHANKVNRAAGLARCAMTELEADLVKRGFTEDDEDIDEIGGSDPDNNCCKGTEFQCTAKVEMIKLPDPSSSTDKGGDLLGNLASSVRGTQFGAGGNSPVSQLASSFSQVAANGNAGNGLGSLAAAGAPNINKVIGDLLVTLYPTLKPMYEAAIRKVTLKVSWKEGEANKKIEVVQYVVQPQRSFGPGL